MKVFDLVCGLGHRFEGWFASAEQFAVQRDASAIACPFCESSEVARAPSAPRLNLAHDARDRSATATGQARSASDGSAVPSTGALAAAALQRLRQLVAGTENVGARFAEEARRIHYAEVPPRAIRGTATDAERRELHDEGIETLRVPVPRALTETLQ